MAQQVAVDLELPERGDLLGGHTHERRREQVEQIRLAEPRERRRVAVRNRVAERGVRHAVDAQPLERRMQQAALERVGDVLAQQRALAVAARAAAGGRHARGGGRARCWGGSARLELARERQAVDLVDRHPLRRVRQVARRVRLVGVR